MSCQIPTMYVTPLFLQLFFFIEFIQAVQCAMPALGALLWVLTFFRPTNGHPYTMGYHPTAVTGVLLLTTCIESWLITKIGVINGTFYALLTSGADRDSICVFLLQATGTVLCIALSKGLCKSLVAYLALQLRHHISNSLLKQYLTTNHAPYHLVAHANPDLPDIDNP